MPATANELARALAQGHETRFRISVGPRRDYLNEALFVAGEPVTLPSVATLAADVSARDTTIALTSAAGYPTRGMIVIEPDSERTGWYCYTGISTNTLTGVKYVHGYPFHAAGSPASMWADISDRVFHSSLQGREWKDGNLYLWEWQIAGERYHSDLLKPDSAILIEYRTMPDGADGVWTPWRVFALGYVREWQAEGDARQQRRWSATVQSVWTYVQSQRIPATRYGRVNLAAGASVTVSDTLANELNELDEWPTGAPGEVSGDNLTDENTDTLWISEIVPSSVAETPASSGASPDPLINEVYLEGPVLAPGLQWVEIRLPPDSPRYNEEGVELGYYYLSYSGTDYHPSFVPEWPDEVGGGNATDYSTNYIRLPEGERLDENNDRIILTNDAAAFRRLYNVSSRVRVFDWRELPGFSDDQFPGRNVELSATNEVLHLRMRYANVEHTVRDMVAWWDGDGTPVGLWSGAEDEDYSAAQWDPGTPVTAPAMGNSIRRKPACGDTNDAGDWDEEEEPNPADARTDTDDAWASVELPLFEVTLTDSVTGSVPAAGSWLECADASYLAASGTLLVDTEQVTYSERTDAAVKVIARGANGTTAASHTAGALIYQVDAEMGAHRLPTVGSVELRRWRRTYLEVPLPDGTTRSYPVMPIKFEVWGSVLESPRYPGEANYKEDWVGNGRLVLYDTPLNSTSTRITVPIPAQPLRHIMVRIRRMNDDGRAKLNELLVWRYQVSNAPLAAGGLSAILTSLLSMVVEVSAISIDDAAFDGVPSDIVLTEGTLGTILRDWSETYGFVVDFTRDGQISISRDPFHPMATRPAVYATLEPLMMRSPHQATYPSRIGISQVVVRITDRESGEVFEGRYPPLAGPGEVETHELEIASGSVELAARAAQARYLAHAQISRALSFTTAGPAEWIRPGLRLVGFDYSDDARPEGKYVNLLVTSVMHEAGGRGVQVVEAQEWRML